MPSAFKGADMQEGVTAVETPTWRKVVNFPLVAMIISIVLLMVASLVAPFVIGIIAGVADPSFQSTPAEIKTLLTGRYLLPASIVEIAASVLVYKLVIRHLGDRPRDDLTLAGAARDGGHGVLAGAVVFSVIVGLAALFGVYHITGGGSWSSFVTILVGMGLMPGFREELLFRGVLFRFLEEFGGSWTALLLTSALFGLAHLMNQGATWFSSFAIAVEAGILLGAVYMLTRNLWMAMGLHAAWNFTQGFIWDVPVSGFPVDGLVTARLDGPPLLSGGTFGLEASLIALVCATALGLFYLAMAVKRGHVVKPWWVRRRPTSTPTGTPLPSDA